MATDRLAALVAAATRISHAEIGARLRVLANTNEEISWGAALYKADDSREGGVGEGNPQSGA